MALKRTLVQEEYLMISTGSDPATGYLSFYPKTDGNFYKRTSEGVERRLLTSDDSFWTASGNNIYNANAGNVGIGTNNPVSSLDLNNGIFSRWSSGWAGINNTVITPQQNMLAFSDKNPDVIITMSKNTYTYYTIDRALDGNANTYARWIDAYPLEVTFEFSERKQYRFLCGIGFPGDTYALSNIKIELYRDDIDLWDTVLDVSDNDKDAVYAVVYKLNIKKVRFTVSDPVKPCRINAFILASDFDRTGYNLSKAGDTIYGQLSSLVPTGTAPFVIASTTVNTNLNADLLDDQHGAYYLDYDNLTNKPTSFSPAAHTHDDRYFTETESDARYALASHTHNYLSGSGTANYLSKFAAAGVLANSVIYEEDGLVGIGTNSPAHELHVNGTVGASQIRVQSGNDVLLLTGTYLEFGDSFNYNALFKVNANSIEISGNDMNNWTAFPISIGSVGGGFGNGRYIKIDDTLDTFTINFSKVKLPLGTANAFVKTNASKELVYDTNSYALNNHTHSTYVLKAGDVMTGNLLIHKTNSGSVNAQFGIKADATSNRYHEFRITSISDSDIYETALQMLTPTPTIYSMLIGNVGVELGAQLFLGGANWDSLSIFASTDVIGNAAYVYVCDASDNVKKVPVASFGGSSGLTSVGLKMPNIFNVSNSPLIANGDIVVTLNSQAKSNVLISPNNSAGVPQFRALTTEDMPDLSQMFDNYLGWNMQVNSNPQRLIVSAAQTPSINQSKGIKFISGTNVTLNQTEVSGISNITINQSGGSLYTTQVTLNQSPAPISSGTWTDVPTMLINTWGDGTYLVSAHVNMAKATTGAGTVGMRVIDNASSVIASKEHYMASTTTNRASLSFVSSFVVSKSSPSSVKMQIHSSTTGWSAVATTLSTPISDNATQILVIKIA